MQFFWHFYFFHFQIFVDRSQNFFFTVLTLERVTFRFNKIIVAHYCETWTAWNYNDIRFIWNRIFKTLLLQFYHTSGRGHCTSTPNHPPLMIKFWVDKFTELISCFRLSFLPAKTLTIWVRSSFLLVVAHARAQCDWRRFQSLITPSILDLFRKFLCYFRFKYIQKSYENFCSLWNLNVQLSKKL